MADPNFAIGMFSTAAKFGLSTASTVSNAQSAVGQLKSQANDFVKRIEEEKAFARESALVQASQLQQGIGAVESAVATSNIIGGATAAQLEATLRTDAALTQSSQARARSTRVQQARSGIDDALAEMKRTRVNAALNIFGSLVGAGSSAAALGSGVKAANDPGRGSSMPTLQSPTLTPPKASFSLGANTKLSLMDFE